MHVNVTFMRVFRHFHTILNYLVPTAECNGPCTQVKDVTHTPGELQIIESKCLSKFLTFLTIICPLSHSSKNILVPQVVFSNFISILSHTKLLYMFLTKKKSFRPEKHNRVCNSPHSVTS